MREQRTETRDLKIISLKNLSSLLSRLSSSKKQSMKKTFLILTSVLGSIAIIIMLTAGGDSKFSRGYSEYERLLKKAISKDDELSKQLSKSREVINATNTSISDLEKVSGENVNSVYAVFGIALVAKHKSNSDTKETNLFIAAPESRDY